MQVFDAHKLAAVWAARLRCDAVDLDRPGVVVRGDDRLDFGRVHMFRHGDAVVVRLHPDLLADVAGDLDALLRDEEVPRLPAYEFLYLAADDFRPADTSAVRQLTDADAALVDRLHAACPRRERELSVVRAGHPVLFGSFAGSELAAAASFIFEGEHVADVGILAHPDHRGRGHGRAAVSALCQWGLAHGWLVQYATRIDNVASGRLARSLGFRLYGVEEILEPD